MGTLINYIGNYDYYLEKKETQEKAYLASAAQATNRSAKSSGAGNTGTFQPSDRCGRSQIRLLFLEMALVPLLLRPLLP